MNTFVLIGLVLLLVGVLVANRRKRAAGGSGASTSTRADRPARGLRRRREAPSQGLSAPSAFPESSPFGDPSPFGPPSPFAEPTPFDRPAPFAESAPVAAFAPQPAAVADIPVPPAAETAEWAAAETIVEPGWPLPGEISGAWASAPAPAPAPAPVAAGYGPGPSVAEWETAATTTTTVEAPPGHAAAGDAAIAEAAEAWEMPALSPIAHEADAPPADAPLWVPEAPAAQTPAPLWEPEPSSPVAEAPAWTPEAAPVHEPWGAVPAPGQPAETEPLAQEPPTVESAPVEPIAIEPPAPEPAVVPAAPVAVAPEPVVEAEAEVEVVWAPAPTWAPVHDAEPEPEAVAPAAPEPVLVGGAAEPAADLREQSAQVAALVPGAIATLRPITRVSDHLGITPRMLVVIAALAERPLSVTEQAAVLGVSRPVVADISARLEGSGLATRERDARDRRRIRVALTERGRRLHEESGEASAGDVEAALGRMDPGDRDHLLRGLRALARHSAA